MPSQNIENKPIKESVDKKNVATNLSQTDGDLLISDLGWSGAEAKETYYRLMNFKEDWEAPGMEAYDEL